MLRPSLTLLSVAIAAYLRAQGPYWANDFGSLGADAVNDVKTDASGNVYVIGEFSLGITYDGSTFISSGTTDAFVAKLDAGGSLLWWQQAGGPGVERGLKLVVAGGSVAVTGQFMGTADLFGFTATSAGGTQDIFTAKLDANTGGAFWVKTGGAALAADRPYGIELSPNGNVSVAGDFRGTADFSGSTITSAFDPLLSAPGFDVFIASYNSTGTLLWLQQGTATHTDRAIDLVSDAASNLYVCGQFSDTITFDLPHENIMTNASFLVKFDAGGTEQWFRRFGGAAFNHVRDLQLASSGELLLCGDLQGSMTFFDTSPNNITSPDAYAYYLMRVDLAGEEVAHSTEGSDNNVSAGAIDQSGGTVAVLGTFDCRMTGLSDFYGGTGLFMATGPEDLFITRHAFPSFTLNDAQQFGGQHHKYSGGIATSTGGALVFGGSYLKLLVIPSDDQVWGDTVGCSIVGSSAGYSYCGDDNYGEYNWLNSAGAVDGFVGRAYVTGRAPYDAWNRSGSVVCDRSELEPCLMHEGIFPADCPDTIHLCNPGALWAMWSNPNPPPPVLYNLAFSYWEEEFPGCDSAAYTGWDISYLWNDGSTSYFVVAFTPGWYWCTVSSSNGCFSWTDSVYVQFEPSTVPHISDGFGVNVDAIFPVALECVDSVWIWCPNVPPGYTVNWSGGVNNDSVYVTNTGTYTVTLVSPGGCAQSNYIAVTIGEASTLPNITGMEVDLNVPDTVLQCLNSLLSGSATITWYIDSVPAAPDPSLTMHVTNGTTGYYASMSSNLTWFTQVLSSGWTQVEMTIDIFDPPCGLDTLTFVVTDSIYILFVPWAYSTIAAPTFICPGDTVPLVLQCTGCNSISWQGLGIVDISTDEDTAWVNLPGVYTVTIAGSYMGLTCPSIIGVSVLLAEPPPIYIDPPEGIVCPGDTAFIYTFYGPADYYWTGPLGGIADNNDSIQATEPGEYFLTTVDANGCVLSNGPVDLDIYGSPYISAWPDANFCPGDGPITISVNAAPGAVIFWDPPLAGSWPSQDLSDPGTYTANVTSCGVTYSVNITLTVGSPNVQLIDPGPFTICDGDSVLIEGPPGLSDYLWWPGGGTGQVIWASAAGPYNVTAEDLDGCAGASDTAFVIVNEMPGPVTAFGDTICAGDTAIATAIGAWPITWYEWPLGIVPIGTGPTLIDGPLSQNDTLMVSQANGTCFGPNENVVIYVNPAPPPPTITGDPTLCEGDTLNLLATATPGSQFAWSTPVGSANTAAFSYAPVDASSSGAYTVIATLNDCASAPAGITVIVAPPPASPAITGDVFLCTGDALSLTAAGAPGAQYGWTTPVGTGSSALFIYAPVDSASSGSYICFITLNGCESAINSVEVLIDPCAPDTMPPIFFPNVITPNHDGQNDYFELIGYGGPVQLRIFNRWGVLIAELNGRTVKWDGRTQSTNLPVSDGVYYYEAIVPRGVEGTIRKAGYVQVIR